MKTNLHLIFIKMVEEKLSKKQKKALSFRKTKEEREEEKQAKAQEKATKEESKKRSIQQDEESSNDGKTTSDEQPKKKRKTRRGKKGKGTNGGQGPRFILFCGNLPYDVQQAELEEHFKNAKPDRFRIRKDKGIAFLEFDSDTQEVHSKMEHALRMHKSTLRNRKINVELTVGGGGNSEARQQKLKEKNEKLIEERKERIRKQSKKSAETKDADNEGLSDATPQPAMHPARAAMLK